MYGEQMIVDVWVIVVDIRDRDEDKMAALPHCAQCCDECLKAFEGSGAAKSDDQVSVAWHTIVLQCGTDLLFWQWSELVILDQNTGRIGCELRSLEMIKTLQVGRERGTEIGNCHIGCRARQG